jgi:flavorubredoxin
VKTALLIYFSSTGNTQKVAQAIKDGLEAGGVTVEIKKPTEAFNIDFYSYNLVCVGTPSIEWKPAKPVFDLLKAKLNQYRSEGKIQLSAPKIAAKNALLFVTYSGPHTGADEAIPAGKTMRQYFEHFGFNIAGEWYILSEFVGRDEWNLKGRMGDIRGKPNAEELAKVKNDAQKLARQL